MFRIVSIYLGAVFGCISGQGAAILLLDVGFSWAQLVVFPLVVTPIICVLSRRLDRWLGY